MQGGLPIIPNAESIPAPSWLFHILELGLFSIHLLLVSIVLGLSLVALAARFLKPQGPLGGAVASAYHRLPIFFALSVTLGVAPLLFVQVLYGQFFYTSSVLMARYWILIIPLIILAYYGVYIRVKTRNPRAFLPSLAIVVTGLVLLYIAFMQVSNNLLMATPGTWGDYFANRKGSILPLGDPGLYPRYLHFVVAAVALGGLALAFLPKAPALPEEDWKAGAQAGLRLFAWASSIEALVGVWYLFSLPPGFAKAFMGGDPWSTLVFLLGVAAGTAAVILAFLGKRLPTAVLALAALLAMVLARDALRSLYLDSRFRISSLVVAPQYDVLALFLVILVAGLVLVAYMLKLGFRDRKAGGKA